MAKVFSGIDYYNMAVANASIARLHFACFGSLYDILDHIKTIDDPYWMEKLSKDTYVALIAAGKNCPIAEIAV